MILKRRRSFIIEKAMIILCMLISVGFTGLGAYVLYDFIVNVDHKQLIIDVGKDVKDIIKEIEED